MAITALSMEEILSAQKILAAIDQIRAGFGPGIKPHVCISIHAGATKETVEEVARLFRKQAEYHDLGERHSGLIKLDDAEVLIFYPAEKGGS
jgi:alkanesulfonate monooxygenase SsuD/methylene tetrahydromethanopterin reductase-like flavin-dependent oxidoreductase (luciferase family)